MQLRAIGEDKSLAQIRRVAPQCRHKNVRRGNEDRARTERARQRPHEDEPSAGVFVRIGAEAGLAVYRAEAFVLPNVIDADRAHAFPHKIPHQVQPGLVHAPNDNGGQSLPPRSGWASTRRWRPRMSFPSSDPSAAPIIHDFDKFIGQSPKGRNTVCEGAGGLAESGQGRVTTGICSCANERRRGTCGNRW